MVSFDLMNGGGQGVSRWWHRCWAFRPLRRQKYTYEGRRGCVPVGFNVETMVDSRRKARWRQHPEKLAERRDGGPRWEGGRLEPGFLVVRHRLYVYRWVWMMESCSAYNERQGFYLVVGTGQIDTICIDRSVSFRSVSFRNRNKLASERTREATI
jgi:hypothetical protein